MAYYISVPLKRTSEVDLIKPLKNLISSYYSTSDEPIDCNEALSELNKLRNNAICKTLDKHENSLEILGRYYDQLATLETKCPPQDIQIAFKWKDAFERGSFFGGATSLTVNSLGYEKICVLFNIAAMHSQIAAVKAGDLIDDDALKTAAKHFQMASGIFHHLKNVSVGVLTGYEPTPDLQPDTLSALQVVMLAQAQECFLYKAIAGNMKDAIIAKVASQCEDLYTESLKQLQKDSLRSLWDKEWISVVASKKAQFGAMAEYFQSLVNNAAKDIGEELARLQHALELIKVAEVKGGYNFTGKEYSNRIRNAYETARKDNDFIYHARIPEHRSLTPIGKAVLAKPTPLPEHFSSNFNDMFSALLPVAVQQAVQVFDVRKTEIINVELGKLREQTQLLNAVLASLNLPAALEDSGGQSLPQSIKEKIAEINEKGGLQALQKLLDDLPILLERNRDILYEAERMIKEEEDSDNHFRAQFKEKWTRTPSEKLNAPFRDTAAKYRQILANATNADNIVRDKFNEHCDTLKLMSLPENEILSHLPSSGLAGNPPEGSALSKLKQLMAQVNDMRKERESIEKDFNSCSFDMKNQFLAALAKDGAIPEEAISARNLEEAFGPLRQRIKNSLDQQERLVAEIQAVNSEFTAQKGGSTAASQREKVLKDMAAAYDAYLDIMFQLEKGTQFYNDLTQLLMEFQQKISDFCFARRTEQEDKCKEIQQTIVSQTPRAPSNAPVPSKPSEPSRPAPTPPSSTSSSSSAYKPPSAIQPYPTSTSTPYQPPSSTAPSYQPAGASVPTAANPPYPTYSPYNPYATYPPPMSAYNPYAQPVMPFPNMAPGYPYPQSGGPSYPYPYPQQPYPNQQGPR